jgi:hypothetical protein
MIGSIFPIRHSGMQLFAVLWGLERAGCGGCVVDGVRKLEVENVVFTRRGNLRPRQSILTRRRGGAEETRSGREFFEELRSKAKAEFAEEAEIPSLVRPKLLL